MDTKNIYHEVIQQLQQKGFCQDFVLFGNSLLWVQAKLFICENDFVILEYHRFAHPEGDEQDLVILGVAAIDQSVRGILLNHYSYNSRIPAVIIKKLRQLGLYAAENPVNSNQIIQSSIN